jgi:hypothetical protein
MKMTTENVSNFEIASRLKLRFETAVGMISVEDLWSLPLTSNSKVSLDSLAVSLNKELKGSEESFVTSTKKDEVLKLKFDIVKHVIDVRIEESRKKTEEVQRKAKMENIDNLITQKQNEKMASLTLEELEALKANI